MSDKELAGWLIRTYGYEETHHIAHRLLDLSAKVDDLQGRFDNAMELIMVLDKEIKELRTVGNKLAEATFSQSEVEKMIAEKNWRDATLKGGR